MGLYESELSRQIHLRSRQKKEWQIQRKKMEEAAAAKASKPVEIEKQILEDKKKEDIREMEETATSKQLAATMVRSSAASNQVETLQNCVDLLNNQNGHLITMKRSTKTLVHSSKLETERDKVFADNQAKMMDILMNVQTVVLRLATQFDMRKKINIDQFFPIQSDAAMASFLDKTDGQFQIKREEFENFMYCSVTNNLKIKRPFEAHILATLFGRDYIKSHKWPGPGYECPSYLNYFVTNDSPNYYKKKKLYSIEFYASMST